MHCHFTFFIQVIKIIKPSNLVFLKTHFRSVDKKFDLLPKHTFNLAKFDLVIISRYFKCSLDISKNTETQQFTFNNANIPFLN
jgi:hypothetical protein